MDNYWVGFDEDITCAGGDILIDGIFTRGFIVGTFTNFFCARSKWTDFPLFYVDSIVFLE